ncbi:Ribosome-recycling factor [Candidatus Fokinia solitaria]|uniref:Ribosome-recycling factor n=1 Tax=Candidatus Fokinia solitaria TaxID=1802984 RepID=A0A2U8BSE9_9RICK|nr:ribosome recycling factor [Candidatus Fokinia solitaria]AWD33284.1 Ribosome-recycling factor [Candidatus Fokinia solitaria]
MKRSKDTNKRKFLLLKYAAIDSCIMLIIQRKHAKMLSVEEISALFADMARKMEGAIEKYKELLGGLRVGRATPGMVENIQVDAYGGKMPINQLANVSVAEARVLLVKVWDDSVVSKVEKAIVDANIGLNPRTEGSTLKINIPELSVEMREQLKKKAASYAESQKIAIRNVRRYALDVLKNLEKEKVIDENAVKDSSKRVQKMTDEYVEQIDKLLDKKYSEMD